MEQVKAVDCACSADDAKKPEAPDGTVVDATVPADVVKPVKPVPPVPADQLIVPLHVTNPTPYRRVQPVIFGTRKPQGRMTYKTLPQSCLNVALVDIPANHIGLVKGVELNPKEHLTIHKTIQQVLPPGAGGVQSDPANYLKFHAVLNGERLELFPVATHTIHKDLFSFEYAARSAAGTVKMWTYMFHNHPIVHFEFAYYCESLQTPNRQVMLSLEITAGAIPVVFKVHHGNVASLINQQVDDLQGRTWKGLMGFYVPSLLTQEEITTFFGEWEFPLFAMAKWETWGPWDKPVPPISEAIIQQQINSRKNLNYSQLFGHFGQIGNRGPGDTGDQAGWGTWQQYIGVGAQRSELMLFDYLAAMQDNVRPVHYFEPNGGRFKASEHWSGSTCVFWSQRVHWHPGVSHNRLGRVHGGEISQGWGGYDNQHAGGTVIANQCILNGSLAAQEYCRSHTQAIIAQHTLPSIFTRWSTNGWEGGRGARLWMAAVMHYLGTGDEDGIRHIVRQLNEMFFNNYVTYNGTMGGKFDGIDHPDWQIKPTSIKGPSPASGALLLYVSWTVWEDALWTMCADTIWPILHKLGFVTEANGLKKAVYDVARSVTMHGFHPERLECGVALRWNFDGTPCENYNDPTMATFSHGYNAWAYPCIEIAKREATERGDQELLGRANAMIAAIGDNYHANNAVYFLQFEGAK